MPKPNQPPLHQDLTDPDTIHHFIKRAKNVAKRRGYPELADDFSQEIFIAFARGWRSTVDQLFSSYLRDQHGNPRFPSGVARRIARSRTVSLDAPIGQEEDSPSLHERIADSRGDSEHEWEAGRYSYCFGGREAEFYQLYFVEQQTEKVIGDLFAITESRVSQILGVMKEKIRNQAILGDGYERIEWDESFLSFRIEWAVI